MWGSSRSQLARAVLLSSAGKLCALALGFKCRGQASEVTLHHELVEHKLVKPKGWHDTPLRLAFGPGCRELHGDLSAVVVSLRWHNLSLDDQMLRQVLLLAAAQRSAAAHQVGLLLIGLASWRLPWQ